MTPLLYINSLESGFHVSWRNLVQILEPIYFLNIKQHNLTSLYQLWRIRFSCIMKNFSQNFGHYIFSEYHKTWPHWPLLYINSWVLGFHVSWRIWAKNLDPIYFLNITQHDPTSLYQLLKIRFSCIMKNFSPNFGPYLFFEYHTNWPYFSISTLEN